MDIKYTPIFLMLYVLLIFLGGIVGYVKSGSVPSILMATLFSILLMFSSCIIIKKKTLGLVISSLLVGVLFAFFTYRLYVTGSFIPGGIMSFLSCVTLAFLYFSYKKSR